MAPSLQLIRRKDLDESAYRQCISTDEIDGRGQIYPELDFLDYVAPGWRCFVYGDYEAVMPHYVVRKYGLPCVVMPPITQQLGVYGRAGAPVEAFYGLLNKQYPVIDYQAGSIPAKYITRERVNLLVDLPDEESELLSKWSKSPKYVLGKAKRRGYTTEKSDLLTINSMHFFATLNPHYEYAKGALGRLLHDAPSRLSLMVYKGYASNGGVRGYEVVGKTTQRVHPLYRQITNEIAKKDGLMVLMQHQAMVDHLALGLTLDLGGSEVPNVYAFLKRFGAYEEPYHYLRKRPWPLR